MRHTERLLDWFERNRTITPHEAATSLGNMRLADSVHKLRKRGHLIATELMDTVNRFGEPTRPARYHYQGKDSES